jgi:hypothetical protein
MRRLAKYASSLALFSAVTTFAAPNQTASDNAMQVRADQILTQLEVDTQHVMHLKELAKKQQDVIKLNCINDRVVQLKAQRNIADNTNVQLQGALARGAEDHQPQSREQLLAELNDVGESVRHLREQASSCVGESELGNQTSQTTVTRPVIVDDPTLLNFTVPVEAPAYASPFD